MDKHRILYVAPEIAIPGTHGGSSHVEGVVRSLQKMGQQVILLSKWEKGLSFYEKQKNLTIIRKPFPPIGILKNLFYILYSLFLTPLFMLFYSVDVVYERSRLFSGIAIFYAKLFNKKSVFELNEPLETIGERTLFHKFAVCWGKIVANRATLVTGTHPVFFKHLSRKNSLLIPYGVDPTVFGLKHPKSESIRKQYGLHKNKVIFYQGSFAPWHAIPAILAAAKEVVKKDKQVQFFLVGKGKQYELAKLLAKELNIAKHVILPGSVSYEEMPAYLGTATVALAFFDRSHFKKYDYYYSPIKIHEYKSCGKPVVASNIGNLKQLVKDGKNGYSVDEREIKEISKVILKLLKNASLRQKMGKKNRDEAVKIYNWDAINKTILRALHRR